MSALHSPAGADRKRRIPPAFFAGLADFVSVFLLSLGLFTAFLSATYWEIPGHICVWLVLLPLILLFILRLRWWVTPVLLAAGIFAVFLLFQVSDEKEQLMAYWTSFVDWVLHLAPYSEFFQETGGEALLHFLVAFGITAVLFLIVRRFFSLTLLALLHGAVYALLLQYQDADLSGPLLLTVAGMMILLPRVYSRYMERKENKEKGKDTEKSHIERGRMQMIAIPIALVIIGLCQLLVPQDTSVWKSRGLNFIIDDIATLMGDPFAKASSYTSNFSLKNYGYNQESGRLGGPANLRDSLVLQVDTERAVLLRGTVYDKYTGNNWKVSQPDGDFRYNGIFMEQFRGAAFVEAPVYPGRAAKELYETLTDSVSVRVKYQRSTLNTVFTTGAVRDCAIEDPQLNEEIYFNLRGEMYLHRKIPSQTDLTLEGDVWRWRDEDFYENFRELEKEALALDDENMETIAGRYTALPETLPDEVKELTEEITAQLETPYEKAHAIELWIAENCTYTLTPDMPPEDEDFVAHFLETREGYCVYYATAMTVMARQAGIPARYVTGFGLESAEGASGNRKESYAYNATGTTAHAWAELYFHGIGWVDFDPTRGSTGESLIWQETEPDGAEAEILPSSSPVPTPVPVPEEALESGLTEVDEEPQGGWFIAGMIAAVAILTALYGAYRILLHRKINGYRLQRVRSIRENTTEQFDFYFTDMLKQLKLLQMESWPGETLTAFSRRVDLRLEVEGFFFTEIARVQMQAQFRETPPSEKDVEKISAGHGQLEALLTRRLGKLKYFFLRALR